MDYLVRNVLNIKPDSELAKIIAKTEIIANVESNFSRDRRYVSVEEITSSFIEVIGEDFDEVYNKGKISEEASTFEKRLYQFIKNKIYYQKIPNVQFAFA